MTSLVEDLALLCTKFKSGPSFRQWMTISTLSGYSQEVAEHELREAILHGDIITTWHDRCGDFHLLPSEGRSDEPS